MSSLETETLVSHLESRAGEDIHPHVQDQQEV